MDAATFAILCAVFLFGIIMALLFHPLYLIVSLISVFAFAIR